MLSSSLALLFDVLATQNRSGIHRNTLVVSAPSGVTPVVVLVGEAIRGIIEIF